MILVGDVDVRPGEHVVADDERVMRDDMTAPADHAPVADLEYRRGPEILAGHHPGREGDERADEGAGSDRDRAFPEHGPRRERDHRAAAERGEPLPGGRIGGHHAGPLHRFPAPVHRPPAELA
jgi:hypothetical protein